jgi:hypothetical protein
VLKTRKPWAGTRPWTWLASALPPLCKIMGLTLWAFTYSGQLLTEDYYVFNKLAKGLLGTNNI